MPTFSTSWSGMRGGSGKLSFAPHVCSTPSTVYPARNIRQRHGKQCPCAVHRHANAGNTCGKHLAGELIEACIGPAAAGARDRPRARRLAEPGGRLEALQASQQVAPVPGPALPRGPRAGQRLRRIWLCLRWLSCGAALEQRQVDEAVQRPLDARWIHALLFVACRLVQHMLHVHAPTRAGLDRTCSFDMQTLQLLLDPCCRQRHACNKTINERTNQHLSYSPKQGSSSCTIQNLGTRGPNSSPQKQGSEATATNVCVCLPPCWRLPSRPHTRVQQPTTM